jgi:hypothetical protein
MADKEWAVVSLVDAASTVVRVCRTEAEALEAGQDTGVPFTVIEVHPSDRSAPAVDGKKSGSERR